MSNTPEDLEHDLMAAYPGLDEMHYRCIAEQAGFDRVKAMKLARVQYDDMCIKRAQKVNKARCEANTEEAIWA